MTEKNILNNINTILYSTKKPNFNYLEKLLKKEILKSKITKETKQTYLNFLKKYCNYFSSQKKFNDDFILIKVTYSLLKMYNINIKIDNKYREKLNFFQAIEKYSKIIENKKNEQNIFNIQKLDLNLIPEDELEF